MRLAADGVSVVVHDETLRRTASLDAAVDSLTSAELARLDCGSWFNRRFPARARTEFAREGVPTFARVLDLYGPRFSALHVELKCPADKCGALVGADIFRPHRSLVTRRSVGAAQAAGLSAIV